MYDTKIGWCHHTFNPWMGCTKVSPGCANCYAEKLVHGRMKRAKWGKGNARSLTSPETWKQPLAWNREAAKRGVRYRVFCASLADILDPEVPLVWLKHVLDLALSTTHLDWMLLTKRQDQLHRVPEHLKAVTGSETAKNIWLGVSAEDQRHYNLRVSALLAAPASNRFVSVEPMLGPIIMGDLDATPDWIICGGESGGRARTMQAAWARSLRDQCRSLRVPFYFKQWGGNGIEKGGRLMDGKYHSEVLGQEE
jgi:protein gp37